MKNISTNPGLYLHIPFCDTKCGYCDFYSITNNSLRSSFLQALITEILLNKKEPFISNVFDTIYLGGGTPSLLNPDELNLILKALYDNFTIAEHCEITLEANPGTINKEKLNFYKAMGVNRLSIGIQSFNNDELKLLGRIHNSRQAINAYEDARRTGFKNISIDLIYALPDQKLNTWLSSLKKGLHLQPDHISAYNLIFEKGTPFYKKMIRGDLTSKNEDEESQFFSETLSTIEKYGFLQYEVSSYAKSEKFISRHNYKYWNHTNYLSFGPSAHSYWDNQRWSNIRSVRQYIHRVNRGLNIVDFYEKLERDTIIFEKIMLSLRTFDGINLNEFNRDFNQSFLKKHTDLNNNLILNGFAEIKNGFFKLTRKGMLICDEILPGFAPN